MPNESTQIPLPDHAHLPGVNHRPTGGPVEAIAVAAGKAKRNDDSNLRNAFGYGLRLFQHGFFWETHEVLEPVWLQQAPNSREKRFVQGFIQLANACLKMKLKKRKAAARLARIATGCFRDCGGFLPFLGYRVDTAGLENECAKAADELESGKREVAVSIDIRNYIS